MRNEILAYEFRKVILVILKQNFKLTMSRGGSISLCYTVAAGRYLANTPGAYAAIAVAGYVAGSHVSAERADGNSARRATAVDVAFVVVLYPVAAGRRGAVAGRHCAGVG